MARLQSKQNLRVLALASYPQLTAATRYRLSQLRGPLTEHGIQIDVRPFLSDEDMGHLYGHSVARKATAVARAMARRAHDLFEWRCFDVVVVQREAMLVGPPVVEWLLSAVGSRPLVLDIDDPVWLPEQSLVPGPLSKVRRWPGKISWLLTHATLVTCGNRFLATYVGSLGQRARVVPNGIDVARFHPAYRRPRIDSLPTVGWIGSHSTYPYLESVLPSLEAVGRRLPYRLRVVGSSRASVPLDGVSVELLPFDLNREVEDFASLDVGLYPLVDDPWTRGKSGLKALQYLAAGVPYVASPVGVVAEIGIPGTTHLQAITQEEWEVSLESLLRDSDLRAQMGASGRHYAESHHTIEQSAAAMAQALREAAET